MSATSHPYRTPGPDPIRSIGELRLALEAVARHNAHLQRELALARTENRRMREQIASAAPAATYSSRAA